MTCHSTPRQRFPMLARSLSILALGLLVLCPEMARAAETAETILIRTALSRDLTGRRRGNAELMAAAYSEDRFVVYDAASSSSALGWTPTFGDHSRYEADLGRQLAVNRYDVARAVVFIGVWKDKAFVTTIDSGRVIDRQTSTATPYYDRRLWTFTKEDEEWLATGFVSAYGDTITGAASAGIADEQIAKVLRDEAAAWNEGSPGGVAGFVDEEFVAVESQFSANPAAWLIIFADRDEYSEWLEERLDRVAYTVQREVLSVSVGADGQEAVAVTRDHVKAAHKAGDAVHEQPRLTYWLLRRQGGDWLITWAFWKSKELPLPTAGGTAALD